MSDHKNAHANGFGFRMRQSLRACQRDLKDWMTLDVMLTTLRWYPDRSCTCLLQLENCDDIFRLVLPEFICD
jgi:hypothetical protein